MSPNNHYWQIQAGASLAFAFLLLPLASIVWAQEGSSDPIKPVPTSAAHRVSERLDIDPAAVEAAMDRRAELLNRTVDVVFADTSSQERNPASVTLSLTDHPDWIRYNTATTTFEVDVRAIRLFLDESQQTFLPRVVHTGVIANGTASAIPVQNNPQPGYALDLFTAAEQIAEALENNDESIEINVEYQEPILFLMTSSGVVQLSLLSRGESDFTGSPLGRAANVRKALNEHLNSIVIQPGETFSFNSVFVNSSGWKDALVIKSGGALVAEPGGGICQSTTTLYRAVLMAGLPILKRANHSLYVTYYEKYGVGLDATVYAPKQDFVFQNDTNSPVVIIAHAQDTHATVELYGVSDGRMVTIDGPFFASTSSDSESFAEKPLRINQIGWEYAVTYADGRVVDQPVVSTYKAIPKKLKAEFTQQESIAASTVD